MSESDSASQSSYSAGGGGAVAESADARQLNDFNERNDNDLLEQSRTLEDAVFASFFTLSKNRSTTDLRWTAARVLLEFLQLFRVVFNSTLAWKINRDLWVWKAFYWVLFRLVVLPKGYGTYIAVFYVLAVVILVCMVATVWAAVVLKKDESGSTWLRRMVAVLQLVALVLYSIFWVAVLDYMAVLFNCNWAEATSAQGAHHMSFTSYNCLAMPHLAHMCFALVMIVLFCGVTLCMSVSSCERNPLARGHLASPMAAAALRMTLLKIAMVLLSTACGQFGRMQPVLMLICASLITCFMLRSLPFFYDAVNHLWVGLWCGIVFTCCMLVAITYTVNKRPAALQLTYREDMTFAVLYGIFPAVLLGALLSAAWMRWRRRPLAELAAAFAAQASSSAVNLKDVHRFRDSVEAEFLMRTMRKWDEDGVPDPATMQFGEFIIRCAMARLPNQPALLTLYSHFLVDARRDGQTARTQLQLAVKASPSLFDRYFIYACTEAGKKLKSESDGLDLLGYVEYQRSYRACVRAHKLALQAQRQFWHCLLRDSVSFKDLQDGLDNMAKAERQATAVYRRVMERYPTNGKLLKIYGRFLEYVRHDPWGASKFYDEAMKQGTSESLMALAGQGSSGAGSDAASRIAGLMGPVDEKNDTIIIINAAGIIMMVNGAGYRLYGYEKGELEGKNISMLMPHPFSNRHNSFLQHYLMTGESRIMNSIRQVVALHKDRSVFPVSLVVTKLSGVGSDSIFMGVQRSHVLEDDGSVKVWATTNGLLLCCDERFEDTFGVAPRDVVGRSLASMTVDEEGFGKWVAAAMELPAEAVLNGAHRLRSKVLHKYLAPIEVEVTVEFGGSDDVRMLLLRLRCLSDSTALLVTDPKGHIQFATSQMAVLVGYSVKVMMDGMNMAGLLPPPYSQLHAAFMKDPSGKLPLSSCRSGAVVHLINASNNKVPVTLQMSQHDDGEHMQHIIKVLPSSEEALLCQQRVLLVLNHRGVVLSVNGAASKGVFGFSPAALVGRPLAAFVNVFTQWSVQHGDDAGLLMSLGLRAQAGRDVVFRAGVHTPFSDAELATALAGSKAGGSGGGGKDATLSALATRHKERPAVVSLTVMQLDENDDERSGGRLDAEATPVLQLELWRAEGLTSVVEMDGKLAISRVEPMLGLIFGTSAHALLHKSFKSLVGLPADTSAPDLLSSSGKKSMLKQGAAWKTGPVRTLETTHMDEAPLNLQVQAVSKDGKSSNKLLALVRLMDSSTGSLQPLLALHKAAVSGADGGAARLVAAPEDAASGSEAGAANDDDGGSSMSSKGGGHAPGGTDGGRPGSPDLHDRLKSRLHVERWVEDSAPFQHCKEGPEAAAPPLQKQLQLQLPPPQQRGTSQPSRRPGPHAGGADDDDAGHAFVQIGVQGSIAKAGRGGGNDDASDAGHSVASGSQQSGDATSEGLDAAGSAAGSDADDELATDWRRAKRLKKLMRMMTSTTAQLASARFNRHTYVLTLILMAAHVVCFVVLLTQVNARYQTAYEVGDMAQAIERSQMASMRANFVQKCASPSYRGLDVCDERHIDEYLDKLLENYHSLRNIHQGLYLGYSTLKHFADTRLMDYWTFAQLPEVLWFQVTENAADVSANSTTSLWEMGNKFLQSMLDVHFNAKQLGYSLSSTPFFHYVYDNGPDSLFSGYAWSLDVMVDYAWVQLDALNKVLVVLLIVEALLVQITTMSYEFLLLRAANCEAMKRFSVFLALPSATVRSMASRQLQVDDDDKSDLEDDELEALNAAGAAETEQQAATSKAGDAKQSKSVRMSVVGGGDDDDAPAAKKKGGRQASTGRAGTKSAAASKPCKTLWQQLNKRLFGWMSTTFKVNGKKLMPHSSVLWRFMVPLLLWVSAVIVMFGVSFQMLQGLQAPLSSLNAAAHVRFRIARCRVTANMFGFAETTEEIVFWRGRLREELVLLKHEYTALIYGGRIEPVAQGLSYNPSTPAAAFANSAFSKIFFKTTNCLRHDQSGCYGPESPWFDITHTGLDAMVTRYMDEMSVFANLPDALAYPNHTSYSYVTHVGGQDMYDGLATAAGLFVKYTISKFESVKQLHIILLVVTLLLILLFVAKLLRPYTHKLHSQSKAMAGMMSLVDIESHVKSLVLGIRRDALSSSMHMDAATAGAAINAASGGGGGATVLAIGAPGGVSAAALGGSRFSAGGGASAGGSPHAAPAVKGRPSWRQAEEEAEDEGEGEEDEE